MSAHANDRNKPPGRPAVRGLLIVARDQRELYEALQHAYGDEADLTVLVDRRHAERRRTMRPVPGERRHRDRRSAATVAHDLRFQQYVLVRPRTRRPHDGE
jgi:hypothetical protein